MGAFKDVLEPGAIAAIFTLGTWINRQKDPREETDDSHTPLLDGSDSEEHEIEANESVEARCLKLRRMTPHSRVLARFPFLVEIWYWLLIYWIYQGCRAISARVISGNEAIFQKAENHALQILSLEHHIHIDVELFVQRFTLAQIPWLMGLFARVYYSHIIVGVAFYVYCYSCLPRNRYQSIRRTLAIENVIAFVILTLWRCEPPRLLPEEYGFIDVLHHDNSGSSWNQNKFQLTIAAMPSLHFGNSVLIAFCLVKYSPHWFLRVIAPLWPMVMGLTIVATANHFLLDAIVGVLVIATAYRVNRAMLILLPLERGLFRLIRLEKPRQE
ncbi:uncharacterized protein N7459_006691 [Penicillium hispanicum]|uniref:uncharacterized protein n=1 Tax=Penicillium hispanicum TaxID=1080232 RepID=UPI00253FE80E|nr:uncharacterized protein N7459_006691 [Penicillium hispanicum]KAJ5577727.1 hypothetical protein N7459_006691 [Penicillium hispanicum]